MGQNLSYLPNAQQPVPGLPNSMPGAMPPQPPTGGTQNAPAIPAAPGGIDPQLQGVLQQALANPNAGDGFMSPQGQAGGGQPALAAAGAPPAGQPGQPAIPGMPGAPGAPGAGGQQDMMSSLMPGSPTDMLIGGAAGVGLGMGMQWALENKGGTVKLAQGLDRIPGISHAGKAIDNHVMPKLLERPWAQEFFMSHAQGANAGEAVDKAATFFQDRHISRTLDSYGKRSMSKAERTAFTKLSKLQGKNRNFTKFMEVADAEIERLTALRAKDSQAVSGSAIRALKGLRNGIKGLNTTSLPLYREQAQLAYELRGTGAIGRGFANVTHAVQRVFGGNTMLDSMKFLRRKGGQQAAESVANASGGRIVSLLNGPVAQGAKRWGGRMLGPFLAGTFILGQSFSKARKAQNDPNDHGLFNQKVKTFFHDFFGTGLGMFIGWEGGRKLLNAVGLGEKVFGRFAKTAIFRGARFLPGITWGGTLVEMLSMFGIASIGTKVFSGIADKIFGKPNKANLELDKPNSQNANSRPGWKSPNPLTPGPLLTGAAPQTPGIPGAATPPQNSGPAALPAGGSLLNRQGMNGLYNQFSQPAAMGAPPAQPAGMGAPAAQPAAMPFSSSAPTPQQISQSTISR